MNRHKFYLQNSTETVDAAEKKFDFISDLTITGAAKSLDKQCYFYTQEIAEMKSVRQNSQSAERMLKNYRDYAFRNHRRSGI